MYVCTCLMQLGVNKYTVLGTGIKSKYYIWGERTARTRHQRACGGGEGVLQGKGEQQERFVIFHKGIRTFRTVDGDDK